MGFQWLEKKNQLIKENEKYTNCLINCKIKRQLLVLNYEN